MPKLFAALICLSLSPLVFAQSVTLPLTDYDKLRDTDQPESVTVVDTLRLSGTFKERALTATFIGKSVGKRTAIPVLNATGSLSLWGCTGNAVITRADNAFNITPLAQSFSATCRISAAGSDRLELAGTRDVLAIESSVSDGELVAGEKSAEGISQYSLVRQSGIGGENVAPTATGHYLITLLPDETRFRYEIDVHNPNRSRRPFEVRMRSGEHVQQVDAVAAYETVDGAYRFDLAPGDTKIVLTGQLGGDAFTPPVEASLQYVAIENHPIVRPVINASLKRISAAETGVPVQFRGPQAFLIEKNQTIQWKKTKLEAMHTTSYAVSGARHTFFIPAEGSVLGETIFAVDNQGASDVKLPLAPEPTYVSIGSEPMLMTKGADGKLTVPLSAGKQEIFVQHRQGIRHFAGFGTGRLVVPQFTVPATSLLVTINYPKQWYPLVQSFSTRTKFWGPDSGMAFIFLGVLLWTERVLAYLRLSQRRRLAIAIPLAAASAAFDPIALIVALADAFVTIAWLIPHFKKEKWTMFKGLIATGIVTAGLIVFINNVDTQRKMSMMFTSGSGGIGALSSGISSPGGEMKEFMDEASQQQNAVGLGRVTKEAASNSFNYQGLPARFEIPEGERHSYFGQEMLATDRQHAVTVLLVSSTLLWWLGMSFVFVAAFAVWKSRAEIAAGLRQQLGAGLQVAEA